MNSRWSCRPGGVVGHRPANHHVVGHGDVLVPLGVLRRVESKPSSTTVPLPRRGLDEAPP